MTREPVDREPANREPENREPANREPANREIELKLECEPADLDRLRRSRALSHLKKGKTSTKDLRSIYFDTEDFVLMNNGLALRVREVGATRIQTLKTQTQGDGPASDRGEWEAVLSPESDGPDLNRLPADLRDRIAGLAGEARISPRLVTDIRRIAHRLHIESGGEIEFAIDSGTMRANGRTLPISELELELKSGAPADLYRLALTLADVAPLRVGMRSKAERGHALATGEAPRPIHAEAVALPKDATVEEAYVLIMRHCLAHLLSNEAAAFEGASSEGLHQMRVALRRLRSAFIAFGGRVRNAEVDDMAREARWLTQTIGRARDCDVFLSEILAPSLAEAPRDIGQIALSAAAEKEQGQAWEDARAAIRSPRMTRFVLRLALYLDERGWQSVKGHDAQALRAPVADFAARALDKRLKKAMKLGRDIEKLDVDGRHELRKRLKKLRYTLNFFVALFPSVATAPYLRRLAKLQDVFGALNDYETARSIVNDLERGHLRLADPAARLIAFHERRARKKWRSALKTWRRFCDQPPFWR